MDKKPIETLRLVETWKFTTVEVAGFSSWDAKAFREQLKKCKLQVCSIAGPTLKPDRTSVFYTDWAKEYLDIFRTTTLVLQSSGNRLHTLSGRALENTFNQIADLLVKVAHDLARHGMRVSYHCYPHDFALIDGQPLVSRLFARDDVPENLGLQLDTFWLSHARTDPPAYAALPVHSVHLNERDEEGRCCVFGTHDDKCAKYIRPLMKQGQSLRWIIENDSSDEIANRDEPHMNETIRQCARQWPTFWHSLAASTKD